MGERRDLAPFKSLAESERERQAFFAKAWAQQAKRMAAERMAAERMARVAAPGTSAGGERRVAE